MRQTDIFLDSIKHVRFLYEPMGHNLFMNFDTYIRIQ